MIEKFFNVESLIFFGTYEKGIQIIEGYCYNKPPFIPIYLFNMNKVSMLR